MPIPSRYRGFYPIDWPQLSRVIRFERAAGACEQCGRPHGRTIHHLRDGRWFDPDRGHWRDGRGRRVRVEMPGAFDRIRATRVYLATAHRNHDTADNAPDNLAAWCQRCHMLHDRPEHARRRRITILRRRALGDLFRGLYPF